MKSLNCEWGFIKPIMYLDIYLKQTVHACDFICKMQKVVNGRFFFQIIQLIKVKHSSGSFVINFGNFCTNVCRFHFDIQTVLPIYQLYTFVSDDMTNWNKTHWLGFFLIKICSIYVDNTNKQTQVFTAFALTLMEVFPLLSLLCFDIDNQLDMDGFACFFGV